MKPKTRAKSPTARALADLRKDGRIAAIVERWNQWAKVRQDLFGFADILYLTEGSIVALQVTSATNHAARRTKILVEPNALAWLKAGGLIELWSFAKQGPRGKVKKWVCRKEEIVEADFTKRPVRPEVTAQVQRVKPARSS
jgi:hypothetical protein